MPSPKRWIVRVYIPRESGRVLPADSRAMTEREAQAYASDPRWRLAGVKVEVIELTTAGEMLAA